jgi:hypothetical protein
MRSLKILILTFLPNFYLFAQNPFQERAFNAIGIDTLLQIQKQDTLDYVKAKIKGTWQYYGHYVDGKIIDDTLYTTINLTNDTEGMKIVRQGEIYFVDAKGEKKMNEYDVSNFDFANEDIFQTTMHTTVSNVGKTQFGIAYEVKTCPSFYYLAYHDDRVGITVSNYFLPILKLESHILLIQSSRNEIEYYVKRDK